jgi:hypothetical protein
MPLTSEERSRLFAVDEQGAIQLGELRLTQREAAIMAYSLIDAIERSIDRNQADQPGYHDSKAILERMESPLGKAKAAIGGLF